MTNNNTDSKKRLVLHRDTIANLTSAELEGVNGGTAPPIIAASVRWCVQAAPGIAGALEKFVGWAGARGPNFDVEAGRRARTTAARHR